MGMFDTDKQFAPDGRLDELFPPGPLDSHEGPEFILYGVEQKGTFKTEIGDAAVTWLTVAKLDSPEDRKVVGTFSKPIADKAGEAEPGDFPAVVKTMEVSTEFNPALVLQWIREYEGAGTKAAKK